jgi:hypothetical protein
MPPKIGSGLEMFWGIFLSTYWIEDSNAKLLQLVSFQKKLEIKL